MLKSTTGNDDGTKEIVALAYVGMGVPGQDENILSIVCRFSSVRAMMDILKMLKEQVGWKFQEEQLLTNSSSIEDQLNTSYG